MPRKIYDWTEVQRFHDQGHGFVECQKHFGFSHTAWVKAVKHGRLRSEPRQFTDRRRRYDWTAVQAYYDEGHSYRQCRARFGFCSMAWNKAKCRGELVTRKHGMPLSQLIQGRRNRTHVKGRLLGAGLIENRCDECGISDWRGRPLSIQIDHVNGNGQDHSLENLRMLCPNCHSQTPTFAGRNRKRLRNLQDQAETV